MVPASAEPGEVSRTGGQTTSAAMAMRCPVCDSPLALRPATGRSSKKHFIMLTCPEDARHMRAFITDRDYVAAFVAEQLKHEGWSAWQTVAALRLARKEISQTAEETVRGITKQISGRRIAE